jgi:hypothetical protein
MEVIDIPHFPDTKLTSISLLDHYVAFAYRKSSRSSRIIIKPLLQGKRQVIDFELKETQLNSMVYDQINSSLCL